jgi:hypothetical protein
MQPVEFEYRLVQIIFVAAHIKEKIMILHRVVFQAKIGKADKVVARMKALIEEITEEQRAQFQPRILTDISGSFDTVVLETVHESLATYEQFRTMILQRNSEPDAGPPLSDLVDSGRNEYYTIEM